MVPDINNDGHVGPIEGQVAIEAMRRSRGGGGGTSGDSGGCSCGCALMCLAVAVFLIGMLLVWGS